MTAIFKRAKIASAVAATLTAGLAATSAQAVNISDTGLGEVALIPYYTVKNNTDTYISIVNTDDNEVVAVKIRFRENANTREARDFNIFLSPNDVWTGVVTLNDADVPVIQTSDNSCTAPELLPSEATVPGMRVIRFTSSDYDGTGFKPNDGASTGIERTYDGHVEIFAMGMARPLDSDIAMAAIHVQTPNQAPNEAIPRDCEYIRTLYTTPGVGNTPFKEQFYEPDNVLKVASNLMRVDRGVAATIPVDHLANFYNPVDSTDDLMQVPSNEKPNLRDTTPLIAAQIGTGDATALDISATAGIVVDSFFNPLDRADAVSSLYMATGVVNEYAIGGASNALYDWVLTFPTKNFYVDTTLQTAAPVPPFSQSFNGQSCETIRFDAYDREELHDHLQFSPPEPNVQFGNICYETNVLHFDPFESALAGTDGGNNVYGMSPLNGASSGWVRLEFVSGGSFTGIAGDSYLYRGLPVMGFGIKTFSGGAAEGDSFDYGIIQEHAYLRDISGT
jgi:hypothetical protein